MCDILNISSEVLKLEQQRDSLKGKVQELESIIEAKNKSLQKVKLQLEKERFKSYLYKNILESMNNIKISDIINEDETGLNVYTNDSCNMPVIIHEYFKDQTESKPVNQYQIATSKIKSIKTGKNFRTLKQEKLNEEDIEIKEKQIQKVEEELKIETSSIQILADLEKYFDEVKTTRKYTNVLTNIFQKRSDLLYEYNLGDYINLLKKHVDLLHSIFTKKKYEYKKIVSYIVKSLSPLEQRLIFYDKYYNSDLQADEIQKFKSSLRYHINFPKKYVAFSTDAIYQRFYNYGIAVFSLKELLTQYLINPYGFSNIVHVEVNNSKKADPYSFYILNHIEDTGVRKWKMECRLDDFCKTLAQYIKNYCISLFRKIYFSVFHDNIFREDYRNSAVIFTQDCEQLLQNIMLLSMSKSFCAMVQKIIIQNSTLKPTKLDKFNFTADDQICKKNFNAENDNRDDLLESIKMLFDNISSEDYNKVLIDA